MDDKDRLVRHALARSSLNKLGPEAVPGRALARILDDNQGIGIFFADGLPTAAFQALIDYAGASGHVAPEPDVPVDPEAANGEQPADA